MCQHKRFIVNPYLPHHRNRIAVDCGTCPACQQAKANKKCARIKLHAKTDDIFALFVTLTYDNISLPYIKVDDIPFDVDFDTPVEIPVYRDRHYRINSRTSVCTAIDETRIIDNVIIDNVSHYVTEDGYKHSFIRNNRDFSGCKRPVKRHDDVIGVCLSSDFTSFIKRLKINLHRILNIDGYGLHSYYRVSEYGPTTLRPHFHALLFFKTELYQSLDAIRRAIIKAWPFCDSDILDKEIELARNPANYVSSYVNRGVDFPVFLQTRSLRPSSSHSRFFSLGNRLFSSASVKASLKRGNFTYNDYVFTEDGVPVLTSLPYPEYVCRYYFPRFKGFDGLSLSTIHSFLVRYWTYSDIGYYFNWTFNEFLSFRNALFRCRERLGVGIYEYADLYCKYILQKPLVSLRFQYTSVPNADAYDNLFDYQGNPNFYVDDSYRSSYFNPHHTLNNRSFILTRDRLLESRYYENIKMRKINDYVRNLSQYTYY